MHAIKTYMKRTASACGGFLKKTGRYTVNYFRDKPVAVCVFLAVLLNLLIEALSRHSLLKSFLFLWNAPFSFLCDTLIILLTLMTALFFRRRLFVLSVVSTVWVLLGLANCILLGFRTTPLSAVDFRIMKTAFQVVGYYLNVLDFILIGLLLAGLIAAGVWLWRRAPKSKTNLPRTLGAFVVVMASMFVSMNGIYRVAGLENGFGNLVSAYDNLGFSYCFSYGLFNTGVKKPNDYSGNEIQSILVKLEKQPDKPADNARPNVIFIQLESFFDPNHLMGVTYSEDPTPVFNSLKAAYPSGLLNVPTVGAGTVNTEFEVLTGMALRYFGAGEYPYKTVLKDRTCDSMAYDLRSLGYTATAMHNNVGLFYERFKVFSMLGFDRYVSIEYMQDVAYNSIGWAKDAVLTDEILNVLAASEGPDFIFGITVQGHGKYSVDPDLLEGDIRAEGVEDPEQLAQLNFFLNEIHETDAFIGELLNALNRTGERYVVVLYGDHLPALGLIEADALDNGDIYQTEYVIWNNFGMTGENEELSAYQLGAEVFRRLNFPGSVMQRLHRSREAFSAQTYGLAMHSLQYDLLYGERYSENGKTLTPTDLQMGITEAQITGIRRKGDGIAVSGTGFTPYCWITVNGKNYDTVYQEDGTLFAADIQPERNDEIRVCFGGDDRVILSETEAARY